MATPDILLLIEKYIKKNISEDELDTLENLLKDDKNAQIYKNLVKDDYLLKTKNKYYNANDSFTKVESKIEQTIPKKVIRLKPFYKYAAAASVLLVVALTVFLNNGDNASQFTAPIIVNNNIEIGTDKAILTLESGEEVALEKETNYQLANVTGNGKDLVYDKVVNSKAEMAYNYLTIPRGGQYHITLADGTEVWLNSESQLKYPVAFTEGNTRQVELVYGEAYFDVSPSTDHKGAKFKVFNNAQEVEVLGTEFNIKAYKDETNIYTTLVEGKVAISASNTNQILVPSQQSNLNIQNNNITIYEVDIKSETAWKEGVFRFKDSSLKDIMKVLSRWYDMDVIFENKAMEVVRFKGILGKDQSIEDVLSVIKTISINNYEIHDKTIIIK